MTQPQPTETWDRSNGLGGSDIASIYGVNRWQSKLECYARKVGDLGPLDQTAGMEMGHELEGVLAGRFEKYQRDQGHDCELVTVPTWQVADDQVPYFRHSPDRLWTRETAGDIRGWEGKATTLYLVKEWGPQEEGGPVSDNAFVQSQWYMGRTGAQTWDISVFITIHDTRHYTIERDQELISELEEAGHRFWHDHILKRIPPAPGATEREEQVLRELQPVNRRPLVTLEDHDDLAKIAQALRRATEQRDAAAERVQLLRNRIIEGIADADGIQGSFGTITYKKNKDGDKVDWKATLQDMRTYLALLAGTKRSGIAADALRKLEAILADHTTVKPGPRVFRPKWEDKKSQ